MAAQCKVREKNEERTEERANELIERKSCTIQSLYCLLHILYVLFISKIKNQCFKKVSYNCHDTSLTRVLLANLWER